MKKPTSILLCITFLLAFAVQGCKGTRPDSRAQWIQDAIWELKQFRPTVDTQLAQYDPENKCYYVGSRTLIRMGDDWVYFIVHSLHQENPDRIEIGDVILAIDNKGNTYSNTGHACGGIRLATKTDKGFASLEEFLSTRIDGQKANATGGKPLRIACQWEKLNSPQQGGGGNADPPRASP